MAVDQMYINPSIVSMIIALLGVLFLIAGLVWRAASKLTTIEKDVKGLQRDFHAHLEFHAQSSRLSQPTCAD